MGKTLEFRPTCINHGCSKPVTYSHRDQQGNKRWRIHCGHCQKASYGAWAHAPGVTSYKTGQCSNTDSHLGWACFTDLSSAPSWAKGLTQVDHIDGDHTNNHPSNLDELCPLCHMLKGQQAGDYNNQRRRA